MPVSTAIRGITQSPLAGGVTLIPTPGHTPGHICVYHHASTTLIAGDCFSASEGILRLTEAGFCSDFDLMKRSIKVLLNYDIDRVVCYHDGVVSHNVKEQLRGLCS
jgi:glyoxylase-like metal-dependent hydrolase (beta-lactamase superfamily II)